MKLREKLNFCFFIKAYFEYGCHFPADIFLPSLVLFLESQPRNVRLGGGGKKSILVWAVWVFLKSHCIQGFFFFLFKSWFIFKSHFFNHQNNKCPNGKDWVLEFICDKGICLLSLITLNVSRHPAAAAFLSQEGNSQHQNSSPVRNITGCLAKSEMNS